MSDKLQEIKEALDKYATTRSFEYMAAKEHISINAPGWLDWLIEQLEQAQATIEEQKSNYSDLEDELERINNHLFDSCKQFEQAQAANQKLVECLEWYAGDESKQDQPGYRDFSRYEFDSGQRARQTLCEVKGND